MLTLNDLEIRVSGQPLLSNINLLLNRGERIGLVGPNGAGKSTLLKVLAGWREADGGTIEKAKETTVGYLPQDGVQPETDRTVYREVRQIFEPLLQLHSEVEELQNQLAELDHQSAEHDRVMKEYGEKQHRLEESRFYRLHADIERILTGLGFNQEDMQRPVHEFSGGWLMRIALAKLLLQEPTFLLLDEPTNHLDIESLRWLESFLNQYPGSLIVVSHDRAFLDNMTTRTLALHRGTIEDYAGNFSYYEKEREKRLEQQRAEYENQQKRIKEIQEFIDKFRYNANKASQVQSRIKQLEKMDIVEPPQDDLQDISFSFPPADRAGSIVLRMEDVYKSYDDIEVYHGLDLQVERGDRIAIVGPNGAGKSTLLRMMAGESQPDAGRRELGHNVQLSYFAQHQTETLPLDKSALQVMRDATGYTTETRLRTLLGCFLFEGEDVFKEVSVLSGGEKSRLALARMLLNPANLLLMDEPTNHLDMRSKDMLQQALKQYNGAFVIVSHDRAFLDPLVEKVIEIRPGGHTRTYLGNISYYLSKLEEREASESNTARTNGQSDDTDQLSRKEQRRIEAEKRQAKYEALKPYRKPFEEAEAKIEKLEEQKTEIEDRMAEPDFYDDSEEVQQVSQTYNEIKQQLQQVYDRWEELAEKIHEIEEEYE